MVYKAIYWILYGNLKLKYNLRKVMLEYIIKKIVAESGIRPLKYFQRCSKVPPGVVRKLEVNVKGHSRLSCPTRRGWGGDNLHRPRQIQAGLCLLVTELVVDEGIPLDARGVEEASLQSSFQF